ncbi:MAG TPA: phosphoadenylyl-sulfate reductase [Ktedonobacterales bacterium]|nr:phosphoadenylyl-sulfate reductase [Ktedonobacterales bacterium]
MEKTQPRSDDLDQLAQDLEERSPQEILAWAIDTYRPRITLACSFGGPTGMVLLDMVMQIAPDTPLFYLETGFLFPETHQLIEEAQRKYGISPQAVQTQLTVAQQAAEYGEALWERDPDRCCELRKVIPQRELLKGFDAWITGLRRDQASTRKATPVVAWDNKFGLAKIAPLARWDERAVWRYIYEHDVPYNQLHDQGYPSIGCTNCTRAVAPGEDPRAGRWSGFTKTECGLHTPS